MAMPLAIVHQFDDDDFHSFVHGWLAYEKLTPTPPVWLPLRLQHRVLVHAKVHDFSMVV